MEDDKERPKTEEEKAKEEEQKKTIAEISEIEIKDGDYQVQGNGLCGQQFFEFYSNNNCNNSNTNNQL